MRGRTTKVSVPATHIEPFRWFLPAFQHACAVVVWVGTVSEDSLHGIFAKAVIKIFVVEIESFNRQSGILKDVFAVTAPVQMKAAGFVLVLVSHIQMLFELRAVAEWACTATGFEKSLQALL